MALPPVPSHPAVIESTRRWLEVAVIGLHLCPFARTVHLQGRIRYFVSEARSPSELSQDLRRELVFLKASPTEAVETTLLIHPWVLNDFGEYNQFLNEADALIQSAGLSGEIQVASFHPDYQFAGTDSDDITNFTNRSPFPLLHLLRETSVSAAIDSVLDPAAIPETNMETLRCLGHEGWAELGLDAPP